MQSIQYINNFFKDLSFNEGSHTYTVDNNILPSVSSLIKKVTPIFDEELISSRVSKATNKSQQEILRSWKETSDEACDRGTRVHNFAEAYAYDRNLIPSCPQEAAVKKFWDDMPEHIIPAFVELRMYHKIFAYAGTGDLILYDMSNGSFILGDYKTNKNLFKNFKNQPLLFPFLNMLATPFSKYSIQLSYYQILFEQTGFKVSSRKLIWLDLTGNYIMYNLEDYTSVLTEELSKRN